MNTTKTAATAAPTIVSIVLPQGVMRLSHQFQEKPEELILLLLARAVHQVDWNLANECLPFEGLDEDFDITAAMDKLTLDQIGELEKFNDYAQRVICWHESKHCERNVGGKSPKIPDELALAILEPAGVFTGVEIGGEA